jgi:ribosomal protein S20
VIEEENKKYTSELDTLIKKKKSQMQEDKNENFEKVDID